MPSALFANQRETNLASTVALVEETLAELGHPVPGSRIADPTALHAWRIQKGSAVTRITLIHRTEFTHLRVQSVVMTLDGKLDERGLSPGGNAAEGRRGVIDRDALFAHLLELNATLCGAAFATHGDQVLLVSERSTLDLDASEVLDIIKRLATYADEHDDVLVARFGGSVGAPA